MAPQKKTRERSMGSNNTAEDGLINAHRNDDDTDHGRHTPRRGEERIPLHSQKRLDNVNQYLTPDHTAYWHLSADTERASMGGYAMVKDRTGNNIFRVSGDDKLYLMEIPTEYYEQDQKAKHMRAVDAMAEAVKINPNGGEYSDSRSGSALDKTGEGTSPYTG